MNRKEYNETIKSFKDSEKRLKSLKAGDKIYEHDLADPLGFSYFEHEVVSIDLDEMCVNTKDLSQKGKPSRLYGFSTAKEAGFK